jgi:ABC-type branched-subunit amino acid transport system substrate-binding protein
VETSSEAANAGSADTLSDLIVQRNPDAVMWGGDPDTALALFTDLRRKGFTGPIIGGDALLGGAAQVLPPSNAFAVNPGPDVKVIPLSFRRVYARRFHAGLVGYDAPAFDAANIELNALYTAATHGSLHGSLFSQRAGLLRYVAGARWRGVTGATSFDQNGDTRNTIVSVYASRAGQWRFFGLAPKVHGVKPSG